MAYERYTNGLVDDRDPIGERSPSNDALDQTETGFAEWQLPHRLKYEFIEGLCQRLEEYGDEPDWHGPEVLTGHLVAGGAIEASDIDPAEYDADDGHLLGPPPYWNDAFEGRISPADEEWVGATYFRRQEFWSRCSDNPSARWYGLTWPVDFE
jgi:hypothetical protein